MTPDSVSNNLSEVLRNQLHDLRIDPDSVITARPGALDRLKAQYRAHQEAILLWVGMTVAFLALLGILLVVSNLTARPQANPQAAQPAESTSVSLGDQTLQVTGPSYHRVSPGEAVLVVHLKVDNRSDSQIVLRAGDLLLANDRGGLFPVSWSDLNGASRDGIAEPNHTLVGLEPGGQTSIDVSFLIVGGGPFSLRYQRPGGQAEAASPEISLSPPE
jgi:hypothetical protein